MLDVAIIGGGLAGCSAAIQLVSRGYRVGLFEQKSYPTHKLCGEFLSPEVQPMLRRLGVLEAVMQAGARPIRAAFLTEVGGGSFTTRLPGRALGLSRFCLDFLLFLRARELGARCVDGSAVHGLRGDLTRGFEFTTGGKTFRAAAVLGAFGKRSRLDGTLDRAFLRKSEPFVAFKAHYRGSEPVDRVEVHGFPGGYCGLAPIEGGRINVCWMAREELLRSANGDPASMISEHLFRNDHLRHRFAALERVSENFEAVGQVSLAPKSLFDSGVCMIGDAARMIAPLCGDGMAMALRSAELAVPHVSAFLRGELSPYHFRLRYTRAWKSCFSRRLSLGKLIQNASMYPVGAYTALQFCRLAPGLGEWFVRRTRGTHSASS